ncbi:MAG TPA: Asp-tRNA(Asn)/Glu-tRNA(Gln) amidotransferase subunit GatA [Flavobacteriales bacterium]|nr:Asp-tRNA(Asn)/Glu-tRNA(Gln) amidotransferase subunit GatA [Flavobacteriales bacterium]
MEVRHYSKIREDLFSGKYTCVDLVQHYLRTIESTKHLNAYLEVFTQTALALAKKTDEKIKNRTAGKLAGCVIAIKDNIAYKGHKVSVSSRILEGFESIYTATAIERLLAEDAIIIGRTNCDEFAMGSSNETSYYGNVLNPHNTNCVPGGSSGGSCAAVAAGLCTAALGTDTGGSIRQPASFTGTVGMKPTYGRISRYGLLAYASSFDQIGPVTNNVHDCALLIEVMAGKDAMDSTSSGTAVEPYSALPASTHNHKIAYLKECIENPGLDPEIKRNFYATVEKLKAQGHTVEAVDFPYLDHLVPTYYVLTTAEASSNLARYDGVHYGYRSKGATDVESTYVKSRTEGFGKEVKRRIMLGTFVLSAGYYDAYYTKGLKVRRLIQRKTDEIFRGHDFILTPTTPGTAFEFGANSADPVKMYLEDIFTVQAPICGIPAISIPAGIHSNGLPYGIQLMSPKFTESKLLAFSKTLEGLLA